MYWQKLNASDMVFLDIYCWNPEGLGHWFFISSADQVPWHQALS